MKKQSQNPGLIPCLVSVAALMCISSMAQAQPNILVIWGDDVGYWPKSDGGWEQRPSA